jgi:hypothetical protein
VFAAKASLRSIILFKLTASADYPTRAIAPDLESLLALPRRWRLDVKGVSSSFDQLHCNDSTPAPFADGFVALLLLLGCSCVHQLPRIACVLPRISSLSREWNFLSEMIPFKDYQNMKVLAGIVLLDGRSGSSRRLVGLPALSAGHKTLQIIRIDPDNRIFFLHNQFSAGSA